QSAGSTAATKATIFTGDQRPDLSRRNGMGQARSSDGENTGKRDNAQSNAARPAVSGNHDLTRADGISAAPACKPKPVIGCVSRRGGAQALLTFALQPGRPMSPVCLTALAAPHISVGQRSDERARGCATLLLKCS